MTGSIGGRTPIGSPASPQAIIPTLTAAAAGTPPRRFTESFDKADGAPLGPDLTWTTWGTTALQIPASIANQPENNGNAFSGAYTTWDDPRPFFPDLDYGFGRALAANSEVATGDDMYVEVTVTELVPDVGGNTNRIYMWLRVTPASPASTYPPTSGYVAQLYQSPGVSLIATLNVARTSGGGVLGSSATTGSDLVPGDVLRFSAVGSDLSFSVNGVDIWAYTDGSPELGTFGGIGVEFFAGETPASDYVRLDDFTVYG